MSPQDRKQAIEYLVHQICVPKLTKTISLFLKEQEKDIDFRLGMEKILGNPVRTQPLKLDISQPLEELVNNLLSIEIITKKPNDKNNP